MPRQPIPPGDPPTHLLVLIRRAAGMRAAGASWESIADALDRTPMAIEGWPSRYPMAWRRAAAAAEQELTRDVAAEAVLTLRRHLRSEDEKVSRDAAAKLITYALAVRKRPKAKGATAKPDGITGHLEGLTDGQLDALLDELLPAHAAQHAAGTRCLDADDPSGPA